jgi:acetyl esterase/lipase
VEVLRSQYAQPIVDVAAVRAQLDAQGRMELRRRRAVFQEQDLNGVEGLWTTCKRGASEQVVLYFHGGGYSMGSPRSHMGVQAAIACASGARVLSVDYRLAPEHPCPAATEDALAAYTWLLESGVAARQIVVAGDSSGGGVALSTLVAARDARRPLPAGAVLMSPWLDLGLTGASSREDRGIDYLGPISMGGLAPMYAGDLPLDDGRVSPLFADLSGLPPMLVLVGGEEFLLDDSRRLAERARTVGVEVELEVAPHQVHVYPMFADVSEVGRSALERIGAFVQGLEAEASR